MLQLTEFVKTYPLCTGDGSGTNPFTIPGSVCGQDGDIYFRVQSGNVNQLDAATDSGFSNIVASCSNVYDCSGGGAGTTCGSGTPNTFTEFFYCTAVNGSSC